MNTVAEDEHRPRRRRGRPRGQDSAVVREAALHAAIELIAEHGYAATSMAQVAAAAGISPSGLVHHFPSKSALLGAVLDHRDAQEPSPERHDGSRPWQVFDGLVELAGKNMQQRELVALYTTVIGEAANPDHPAHAWMVRHFDLARGMLERDIGAGRRQGWVREDAPAGRIARTTVAVMDGLQVQWLLDPSIDMEAEMRFHVDELKERWGIAPG